MKDLKDLKDAFMGHSLSAPQELKALLAGPSKHHTSDEVLRFLAVNPRVLCLITEDNLLVLHEIFRLADPSLHQCMDALFTFERDFMRKDVFEKGEHLRLTGAPREWSRLIEDSVNPYIAKGAVLQRLYIALMEAVGKYYDDAECLAEPVASSGARYSLVSEPIRVEEDGRAEFQAIIYDKETKEMRSFICYDPSNHFTRGRVAHLFKNSDGTLEVREVVQRRLEQRKLYSVTMPRELDNCLDRYHFPLDSTEQISPVDIVEYLKEAGYEMVVGGSGDYDCYFRPGRGASVELWNFIKKVKPANSGVSDAQKTATCAGYRQQIMSGKMQIESCLIVKRDTGQVYGWFDSPDFFNSKKKQRPYSSSSTPRVYPIISGVQLFRLTGTWMLNAPFRGSSFSHELFSMFMPQSESAITDDVLKDRKIRIGPKILTLDAEESVIKHEILSMIAFNGYSIRMIEDAMQPGKDDYSLVGFLKPGDSVLEAIHATFLDLKRASLTPELVYTIFSDLRRNDNPINFSLGSVYFCNLYFMLVSPRKSGWVRNRGSCLDPFNHERELQASEYLFVQKQQEGKFSDEGEFSNYKSQAASVIHLTSVGVDLLRQYCFAQTGPYKFSAEEFIKQTIKAMRYPFTGTSAASPPSEFCKIRAADDTTPASPANSKVSLYASLEDKRRGEACAAANEGDSNLTLK